MAELSGRRASALLLWHPPAMEGGAYTADRAAALSGVPRSTVHWWARNEIVVPSVSPARTKLWSYTDLLALRTVYWLRQRKTRTSGSDIPRTTMTEVRRALRELVKVDISLFDHGRPSIFVTPDGHVVIDDARGLRDVAGQGVMSEYADLIAPFSTESTRGVDLIAPSTLVRISPRKLGGAPHVIDTRIGTESLAALHRRGFDIAGIRSLYPDISAEAVEDALGLERQLEENLAA